MKRLLFIFTFFILLVVNGRAQGVETLTLEDCLRIGIDNNLSLESKRREIQKSKYGVSENRARLLPQISAVAGYSNNFDPPVSVTDGSSYGVPYNITQTLQHSANAGLEMQMPLFNQTLYTSMSIAKVVEDICMEYASLFCQRCSLVSVLRCYRASGKDRACYFQYYS